MIIVLNQKRLNKRPLSQIDEPVNLIKSTDPPCLHYLPYSIVFNLVHVAAVAGTQLIAKRRQDPQNELNWPFSISTTHVLLSQLDFIIKLTASISKPRHHLDRYLGDFARGCRQPNAKILNRVVTATKLQAKHKKLISSDKLSPQSLDTIQRLNVSKCSISRIYNTYPPCPPVPPLYSF